ncbi:MAG: hypothetical protein ACFHX7_06255 [Pseudomonadota bacterium]
MTALAVIDPALGFSRGHHLGALEHLSGVVENLVIAGGTARDPSLCDLLSRSGIALQPIFTQPFYQSLDHAPVARVSSYVRQLAKEYIQCFRSIDADCYLYHTLSWEHAEALALAIEYCQHQEGKRPAGKHLVFTMFNPGLNHRGAIVDPMAFCRFKLGFGELSQSARLSLFAPSEEYAIKYQQLLGLRTPLPIHPVFFDSLADSPPLLGKEGAAPMEILYLGDAKTEKGFRRLPDLVRSRLLEAPDYHFVVQYSSNGEEALLPFEAELAAMAELEPRLTVYRGFVPHDTLDTLLATAERVTLDYDPQYYADKSSGVLWLAMARNIRVSTPPGTWLRREASRLSVFAEGGEWNKPRDFEQINQYRKKVFCPFDEWLSKIMAGEE